MGDRRPDQQPERLPARPDVPLIDADAATFERVAAEYELGRPSWPLEAVETHLREQTYHVRLETEVWTARRL